MDPSSVGGESTERREKMTGHEAELRKLQVRVRKSSEGGEAAQKLMVYCPDKHRMMSLDECSECEFYESIRLDPTERDSFLVCRMSEEEDRGDEDLWGSGDLPRTREVTIPPPSNRTAVADVMTRDPLCVPESMSVETLTALLLERGISGAPVIDEDGRPIGIVSKSDLVREHFESADTEEHQQVAVKSPDTGYEYELGPGFHFDRIAHSTVGEIMMPLAFTVPESGSLAMAAGLMAYEGVHRVPVIDPQGKVVGILSSLDVLRWLANQAGFHGTKDVLG
jgi:CBS domain-containing protein